MKAISTMTEKHGPDKWELEDRGRILRQAVLGYDKIVLTGHAQDQMELREITEEDILRTLRNPTKTGLPTQPDRHRVRWHKTARVAIDVVYKDIEGLLHVITVIKITRRLVERRRR